MLLFQLRQVYLAFVISQHISASIAAVSQPQISYSSLTPRSATTDTLQSLENTYDKREAIQKYSLQSRTRPLALPLASRNTVLYYPRDHKAQDVYDLVVVLDQTLTESINDGDVNTWWASRFNQGTLQNLKEGLRIDESAIRTRGTKLEVRIPGRENSFRGCVIFSVRKPLGIENSGSGSWDISALLSAVEAAVWDSISVRCNRRQVNDPIDYLDQEDRDWVQNHNREAPQDIELHEPVQTRPSRPITRLIGNKDAYVYHYNPEDLATRNDFTVTAVLCPMMNEVINFRANGNLEFWWKEATLHDWFLQELYNKFQIPREVVGLYPTTIEVSDTDQMNSPRSPRICIILRIPKHPGPLQDNRLLLWIMRLIGEMQKHQLNVLVDNKQRQGLFHGGEEAAARSNAFNADLVEEMAVRDPLDCVESKEAMDWAEGWLDSAVRRLQKRHVPSISNRAH